MIDFFTPLSHEIQQGVLPVEVAPATFAKYDLTQVLDVADNLPPPKPK